MIYEPSVSSLMLVTQICLVSDVSKKKTIGLKTNREEGGW